MNIQHITVTEDTSISDLADTINALIDHINSLNSPRDRGPKAERTMTEDDAKRVILGDMKDHSHKQAATDLGLSYGQIYSARKGFTFKHLT